MKAKHDIPEVPEPLQAVPQTEPPEPLYKGLRLIARLVPFLEMSKTYPSADACENLNLDAFNSACSLVELVAWGEQALENEVGAATEPILTRAADGITFQLEIMRLTAKTLFEMHRQDAFVRKPR